MCQAAGAVLPAGVERDASAGGTGRRRDEEDERGRLMMQAAFITSTILTLYLMLSLYHQALFYIYTV